MSKISALLGSRLGNRLACKSVGTMFDLSLREWIKYVKFHSSPTRNRDVHFTLQIIEQTYFDDAIE